MSFEPPKIKLEDLSYYECYDCENYFFAVELPMGINDPSFCPYCGVRFDIQIGGDDEQML